MILICFGTRPEYIKVKPLIDNLSNIKTCFTGQHKDLLKNINVDYKLDFKDSFSTNRLNDIVINILQHTYIFDNVEYVIVQGDTTTAFAIALSAYHMNTKVIHLEAGLRTNNIQDPFPEELNRQMISRIADIHLCPTIQNKQNLLNENIDIHKIKISLMMIKAIYLLDEEKKGRLQKLQDLFIENNKLKRNNTNNFLIDLIFILANMFCIKNKIYWIPEHNINPNNSLSK
jgi:UDP-N-acetylglucosamine 2-epimerase (non-hydrolysing)